MCEISYKDLHKPINTSDHVVTFVTIHKSGQLELARNEVVTKLSGRPGSFN